MTVIRIVTNVATPDTELARSFYGDLLGLDVVMDQGWIATFATTVIGRQQISFASEGGSGTAVPDRSRSTMLKPSTTELVQWDSISSIRSRTNRGACAASMRATLSEGS